MAETNYLDPEETPPVAADTQSTDNSKSNVRKAWDVWTSKPENNAALLQFGIAMMQPRAQGQSSLGQFGNAIGEAGEASTRNVAAQEAQQDRTTKRDETQSMADYRKAQGAAALQNAASYGRQVDQSPGGGGMARTKLSFDLRTQQAFRTWLQKPEDMTGMQADPLVAAIKKEFPNIQSKADLISNPLAQKRAYQLYTQQLNQEPPDETGVDPATAAPPGAQPPAGGTAAPLTKTFFDKATGAPRQFQWDGTQWTPMQ